MCDTCHTKHLRTGDLIDGGRVFGVKHVGDGAGGWTADRVFVQFPSGKVVGRSPFMRSLAAR